MKSKFKVENGLDHLVHDSSPSFGTKKTSNSYDYEAFFDSSNKVWQLVAERHPYTLCRLVHHNYDLSKRWFVVFYAWNVATEQKERKRLFEPINRQKTVTKRLAAAKEIMDSTNADLRAGKVLGKQQLKGVSKSVKDELHKRTLLACIDYFVEKKTATKRRVNYVKRFASLKYHIENFYNKEGISDINIRQADSSFFESFFDYLLPLCVSAKTFNNYRADMITVVLFLNRMRPGLVKDHPGRTVDKLKTVAKKHAAFSDDQIKTIIKKCEEFGFTSLAFFIRFEYYTLARPNEILALRVRDIDLPNNRIIFRGDDAKNWRDEYVTINPRFKEIIQHSGILTSQPDDFVFGWSPKQPGKRAYSLGRPGPIRHPDETYFYSRLVKVLDALDYYKINPNYTLYSFKHSGAIALYLETMDLMAVKEQARWTKIQQAEDYLRDLGLLRNISPVMNWKGAI